MKKLDIILKQLTTAGFKHTKVRECMLTLLCTSKNPPVALEFLEYLQSLKLAVNKTTVYREVKFLLEHNVIREIELGEGKKRYELMPNDHHHHIVCTKCGDIEHITLENDLDLLEQEIAQRSNFKIQRHLLEFFGLCDKCQ